MAPQSSGRNVATIERAAEVLFLFAGTRGTLGITDISRQLGISKAVVHRIVTSLCDRNLVAADPATRRYSLGPGVVHLADSYLENLDVRSMASEVLHQLSEATNETATLSVRNGMTRIYVDQVTPPREVKMTVQVAAAFPLHAGASSKAFLAAMPPAFIEEYFANSSLDALTEATVVSKPKLRTELKKIRQQGFAVSAGERQAGAASVAAPILDHHGEPVAVISVCGPIERFRGAIPDAAIALVEVTQELSRRLGARTE